MGALLHSALDPIRQAEAAAGEAADRAFDAAKFGAVLRDIADIRAEQAERAMRHDRQVRECADASTHNACDGALYAAHVIGESPTCFEDDVAVLLGALAKRIRATGNMHLDVWQETVAELEDRLIALSESAAEAREHDTREVKLFGRGA